MTTSGIYTVQYTRDQLITAALRKLSVLSEGQLPNANNLADGTMALNTTVSMFRSLGMPMWERNSYTFSVIAAQQSYTFGTGQQFNTPYPLKVYQLFRTTSGSTIDMDIEADYTFNQLPNNSSGIPIKGTYQAKNNIGVLKLWPVPDSTATASTFTLIYQQPFQYFISASDTADFPEEWYKPLIYWTAVDLAPEWSIPPQDKAELRQEAQQYLDMVLGMGGEDASMFIQPAKR